MWSPPRGASRSRSPTRAAARARPPASRWRRPGSPSRPPAPTRLPCRRVRWSPSRPAPAPVIAGTPWSWSPRSARRWSPFRTCSACRRTRPAPSWSRRASRSRSSTIAENRSSDWSTSSPRRPAASWPRARPSPSPSSDGEPSAAREHLRDQEGQLEGLLVVQARIDQCLVAAGQSLLVDLPGSAEHLGDVVTGQLHVQPGGNRPQPLVDLEEAHHLVEDVLEAAGLVAVGGGDRVAVHGIGDPGDLGSRIAHSLDQGGQTIADVPGSHAGDEGQATRSP